MQVVEQVGASGRRVVVVHAHPRAQRVLQRLASAVVRGVETFDAVEPALATTPDVVIVDADATAIELPARHRAVVWIAAPGDGTAPAMPERTAALLAAGWRHVVTQPVPVLGDDLQAALVALGGGPSDLTGVLLRGVAVGRVRLDDAEDRDAAAAAIVSDVVGMGLSDRVASLARVIADELIANALYAAPVDDAGARLHGPDARGQARPLAGRDVVEIAWGGDARYFAIEVVDQWGSLDLAALGPRLAARIRGGGPDDGLGLGLVHACCQRLHVTVDPGRQTRVVATLDLRHRATALARAGSVHLVG